MKKVAIFFNKNASKLEEEVNLFLDQIDDDCMEDDIIIHYKIDDDMMAVLVEYIEEREPEDEIIGT